MTDWTRPLPADVLRDLDARHIWHPFTQAGNASPPFLAVKAEGATIWDADGKAYLDLVSSWWVNLHGHAHPAIATAIARQAERLEQVIFADATHEPAIRLAARLAEVLPGDLDRVFFSDDGSTAVEVAIKMAHQYWRNLGQDRTVIVGFEGGYHGDTVGAMSAGRSSGYFTAWDDLLFGVETVPFPATWEGDDQVEAKEQATLAALGQVLSAGRVSAVLMEPLIQGAGGMRMCRPQLVRAVADMVRASGALLIFDEVMTGFGRTGSLFACLGADVVPDLICLSKGLTGGFLPMGLTVARDHIWRAFLGTELDRAFLHGHSYTANPLGCAAALASLDLLLSPACQDAIRQIEQVHRARLPAVAARNDVINPRITGTIAAFNIKVADPGYGAAIALKLRQAFRAKGLLLRPLGNVLYLLPPYCIGAGDLERAWDIIASTLGEV